MKEESIQTAPSSVETQKANNTLQPENTSQQNAVSSEEVSKDVKTTAGQSTQDSKESKAKLVVEHIGSWDRGNTQINAYIHQAPSHDTGFKWNMFLKDTAPVFSAIVSLFALIAVIIKNKQDRDHALQLYRNENNKKKRDELNLRIQKLYGPMKELRESSKLLYEIFAVDEKQKEKVEGRRFRTLRFLTTEGKGPEKLLEQDRKILEQITEISRKNLELIETEGWAITNPALSVLLGKLCAHFRVLEAAAKGELMGRAESLEELVFPLETDGAIENEIRKIQKEIKRTFPEWEEKEKNRKKKLQTLSMDKTIKFYDDNHEHYFDITIDQNMSENYERFRRGRVETGHILDAGCGVGRDTQYFIKHGYKVFSFDLSRKMVEATRRYPFAFCEQMSFLDVEFYEEFDGVWANASLLHLNQTDCKEALARLVRATKRGGYIYASFKNEQNAQVDHERDFYYTNEAFLTDTMIQSFGCSLEDMWVSRKDDENPNSESFTNFIWKKSAH